jgi:hypothetical protein
MTLPRTSVAALAITALLVAPVSAAPASSGDSLRGVGIRLSANAVQYTVSVTGGQGGEPSGSFLFRSLAFKLTFGGPVSCFDIDGNLAAIGGWTTHVTPGNRDLVGHPYLVFFEDNGAPSELGQEGPDVVSQTYIFPDDEVFVDVPDDFPNTCPDAAAARSDDPFLVQGNFVVTDL